MCNSKECAAYLKKNPAYRRLMKELQKKWKRYGGITGNIALENSSEDERRAIGGIVGRTLTDGTIKITFQEFEQGLQKTRYAPVDMKAVLEEYFEKTIYTNSERKAQKQLEKDAFFEALFAYLGKFAAKTSVVFRWIKVLQDDKKHGYQILIKEFARDLKDAKTMAQNVGKALIRLEEMDGEECYLAVFAAEVSGNPHYFDRGLTASQVLTHAVCFWKNCDVPQNAYEWRSCMQSVGIVPDSIASMVHAFGVQLETEDGLHPSYEVFNHRKEPYVITSENLKSIVRAKAKNNKVYVVENEMVFLYLIENTKEQNVAFLCTSGQLRVAAFQLLECLCKGGVAIYYSGDLDPEGMDIADRLWQRYGDYIRIWRMDAEDYHESISEEEISERQLAKLERLKNATLCRTAELLRKEKRAGYQENLLTQLLQDVLNDL